MQFCANSKFETRSEKIKIRTRMLYN